jgi:hypothetical protein
VQIAFGRVHRHDPDARITKMKDGRTHLAHKAEHAVDLETSAIVAVTLQSADQGDTATHDQTLAETVQQLIAVDQAITPPIAIADDIVADKGYHSRAKLWEQAIVIALVIRLWARMVATLTPRSRSRHRRHETACGLVMASFTRLLKVGTCTTAC